MAAVMMAVTTRGYVSTDGDRSATWQNGETGREEKATMYMTGNCFSSEMVHIKLKWKERVWQGDT